MEENLKQEYQDILVQYQEEIQDIEKRRKTWTTQTISLLESELKSFVEAVHLEEQKFEYKPFIKNLNMDYIELHLEDWDTHIGDPEKIKFYMKGGSLVFSQLYNGQIMVFITYPYVADEKDEKFLFQKTKNRQLEIINPSDINQAFIQEQLKTYLQQICAWMKDIYIYKEEEEKKQIGFVVSP